MEMISPLNYYDEIKDYDFKQLLDEKSRLEKRISDEENGGNLADYGLSTSGSETMLSFYKEYLIVVENLLNMKKKLMEEKDSIDVLSYAQNRFNQVFANKNSKKFYAMVRRIVKDNSNSLNKNLNMIDWYICDDYLLISDDETGFNQYPITQEKTSEIRRYIQKMDIINNLNVILKYINRFQIDEYDIDYETFFETSINGITIGFSCDNNSEFLNNLYNLICKICNIEIKNSNPEITKENNYTKSVLNLINEIDKEIETLSIQQEEDDIEKEKMNNQKVSEIMRRDYINIGSYANPLDASDDFINNNVNYLLDLSESKIYTERYNGKYNELKFIKKMNDEEKNEIMTFINDNNLLDYKIDNLVMDAGDSINISIDGKKNNIENASSQFTSGKITLYDDLKKLISNMTREGEK